MPTLAVERDVLFNHLNKTYTEDEFDELCFEFGVELDDVTSEREEALKSSTVKLTKEEIRALSDDVVYKIDVPANRYDLLCVEGLSRALRVFLGEIESPIYKLSSPDPMQIMTVRKTNVDKIRPYVVCAILRDVSFTPARYASFIDLQDQLHRNLCRNRSLVAIGTHDYDSVVGPFEYDAKDPDDIEFVPLTSSPSTEGSKFTGRELMEHYETAPSCKHLKPYVPLIKDSPVYPVVLDGEGTVMSLPPIINGSKSKISLDTKNVFVECTATDLTKANVVLDTVVAMFSEYCGIPFEVEPVRVNYVDDSDDNVVKSYVTPELSSRTMTAGVEFVNSLIGIDASPERMVELCNKVQLGPASLETDPETSKQLLRVTVPPTRSDVLHPVDIAEDVGIAYGYNNVVKIVPKTCTVGGEQPLNLLSDLLREEIGRAGYVEVLTHGLCSIEDNFTKIGRDVGQAVSLLNPANKDYQVVRTTLLPGLLLTLQHNKSSSFASGFKLFEISDVVLPDAVHAFTDTVVGSKNVRRVCATYAGPTSGFEIIHGLVDRIMTLTEVAPEASYVSNSGDFREEKFRVARDGWEYTIEPLEENDDEIGTYFPGRAARVMLSDPDTAGGQRRKIGTFGMIHPSVLEKFDVKYPASCIEIDLEPLL